MPFHGFFRQLFSNEVSQSDLNAYRSASRYLDDLDAAIQTRIIERPLKPGKGPWERPSNQHYAMAFATIARELSTIATVLLESDAQEDPGTAGRLPVVTYQQVKALFEQVPVYAQRAWEALANPRYVSDRSLPLSLSPRIEAAGKCPTVHLKGIHAAARSLHALGDHRLQGFLGAVSAAGVKPSEDVKRGLGDLTQLWARAQARFGYASNQLSIVSQGGNVSMQVHEDAEDRLWDSLSDYFILAQLIAMPEMVILGGANAAGRDVTRDDRWFLSHPTAVGKLQGDRWGEEEMQIFWREKRWRTTPREERYLAECKRLVSEGKLRVSGQWATCPFSPLYEALADVRILNRRIPRGYEFNLDMDEDEDELVLGSPKFGRTSGYKEEHEGGH